MLQNIAALLRPLRSLTGTTTTNTNSNTNSNSNSNSNSNILEGLEQNGVSRSASCPKLIRSDIYSPFIPSSIDPDDPLNPKLAEYQHARRVLPRNLSNEIDDDDGNDASNENENDDNDNVDDDEDEDDVDQRAFNSKKLQYDIKLETEDEPISSSMTVSPLANLSDISMVSGEREEEEEEEEEIILLRSKSDSSFLVPSCKILNDNVDMSTNNHLKPTLERKNIMKEEILSPLLKINETPHNENKNINNRIEEEFPTNEMRTTECNKKEDTITPCSSISREHQTEKQSNSTHSWENKQDHSNTEVLTHKENFLQSDKQLNSKCHKKDTSPTPKRLWLRERPILSDSRCSIALDEELAGKRIIEKDDITGNDDQMTPLKSLSKKISTTPLSQCEPNLDNVGDIFDMLHKTKNNRHILLKNFEIRKCVGVGGFGKVVEAINLVDQSRYAMKIIPFSMDEKDNILNGIECLREARSMAKMSSHPNVVRYFTAWTEMMTDELFELVKDIQALKGQQNGTDMIQSDEHTHSGIENTSRTLLSNRPEKDVATPLIKNYLFDSNSDYEKSQNSRFNLSSRLNLADELDINKTFFSSKDNDSEEEEEEEEDNENNENEDEDEDEDEFQIDMNSLKRTLSNRSLVYAAQSASNLFCGMKDTFFNFYQRGLRGSTRSLEDKIELNNSIDDDRREMQNHSHVLIVQMEMCNEGTLKEWLHERSEVDVLLAWNILYQIVQALHHIHACNVLHRDVKPDNVFMCANNVIRLGDFGLSLHLPSEKIAPNDNLDKKTHRAGFTALNLTSGLGTPTYAAPEQIHGMNGQRDGEGNESKPHSYSKAADIYPVGLIAYELFSNLSTNMERLKVFDTLKKTGSLDEKFKKKYPAKLSGLIEQMISQDPTKRPSTEEILHTLNDLYRELYFSIDQDNDSKKPLQYTKSEGSYGLNQGLESSSSTSSSAASSTSPSPPASFMYYTQHLIGCRNIWSSSIEYKRSWECNCENRGELINRTINMNEIERETSKTRLNMTSLHFDNQENQLIGTKESYTPKGTSCQYVDESIVKMKNLEIELLKHRISQLELLLGETNRDVNGSVSS